MVINAFVRRHIFITLSAIFLMGSVPSPVIHAQEIRTGIVEQSLGRDFGLLVGDIIEHYYVVQVPAEYQLTPASLPPSGDLDYWLLLLESEHELIAETSQYRRYRLHFTFQTFYAPLDVRTLEIPPLSISFNANGTTHQLTIPSWHFTMSPLKEIAPRGVAADSAQNAFMKPDLQPLTIATGQLRQQIWVLAITLLVLSLVWLSLKGYLFGFTRSAFQQAYRQIKALRQYASKPSAYHQSLQAVHGAFNKIAGQALFAHQTHDFVKNHPEFAEYQQQIDDFYLQSTEALYTEHTTASVQDFDYLLKLCRQLAGAEKVALKKS